MVSMPSGRVFHEWGASASERSDITMPANHSDLLAEMQRRSPKSLFQTVRFEAIPVVQQLRLVLPVPSLLLKRVDQCPQNALQFYLVYDLGGCRVFAHNDTYFQ